MDPNELPPFDGQCKARSKQTGKRCRRHVTPGSLVCHYHGSRSRHGPGHPAFKHGQYAKKNLWDFLRGDTVVRFVWYYADQEGRLGGYRIGRPPEIVDDREWERVLRAARRQILEAIRALRDGEARG